MSVSDRVDSDYIKVIAGLHQQRRRRGKLHSVFVVQPMAKKRNSRSIVLVKPDCSRLASDSLSGVFVFPAF